MVFACEVNYLISFISCYSNFVGATSDIIFVAYQSLIDGTRSLHCVLSLFVGRLKWKVVPAPTMLSTVIELP